jgi:hypothetical protein
MPLAPRLWPANPRWGLVPTLFVCALVLPAAAQPKKPGDKPAPADAGKPSDKAGDKPTDKKKDGGKDKDKVKNFDFNALDLSGRMRTPQLLYFLERANEELERASLEKRSFIPHIVRSVEEEKL